MPDAHAAEAVVECVAVTNAGLNTDVTDVSPSGLRDAADKWLASLRTRRENEDASDDYLTRAITSIKRLKELVLNFSLESMGRPEIETIRLKFQSKRKSNGALRGRGTVKALSAASAADCGYFRASPG